MNITEEHKKKAQEIKFMLNRLEPQVLYCLANFMDFEGVSDDGMQSQCVYEAADKADVYSSDGKPQELILDMGLSLGSVKIQISFQKVGEESYEIETFDVFSEKPMTE